MSRILITMEALTNSVKIYVLYASQTGNCESISEDFYSALKEKHPQTKRFAFDELMKKKDHYSQIWKKDSLKLVVFFTSSTGNGEFPENGEDFHRFLRRNTANLEEEQTSTVMSHVFYTILGLGDSNYSKFQGAPRYLDWAMEKLGGHKFYYRGEADEGTSLELVVEPWLEGVTDAIEKELLRIRKLPKATIETMLTQSSDTSIPMEGGEKK